MTHQEAPSPGDFCNAFESSFWAQANHPIITQLILFGFNSTSNQAILS